MCPKLWCLKMCCTWTLIIHFTVFVTKTEEVRQPQQLDNQKNHLLWIYCRKQPNATHICQTRGKTGVPCKSVTFSHLHFVTLPFTEMCGFPFLYFRPEKQQKGKLYTALLETFKQNNIGFLPHQKDKTGQKVFTAFRFICKWVSQVSFVNANVVTLQ